MSTSNNKTDVGKRFDCPECSKTFSRNEYVTRHRRLKHLNERNYVCSNLNCNKGFARSDLLLRHRKNCDIQTSEGRKPNKSTNRNIIPEASSSSSSIPVQFQNILQPISPQFKTNSLPSEFIPLSSHSNSVASTSTSNSIPIASNNTNDNAFNFTSRSYQNPTEFERSPEDLPSLSPATSYVGSVTSSSSRNQKERDHSPATPIQFDLHISSLVPSKGEQAEPVFFDINSLTQDEIMASAALGELLRSPSPSQIHSPASVLDSWNSDEEDDDSFSMIISPSTSLESNSSWHGSKLKINSGQENSMAIDTGNWTSTYDGMMLTPFTNDLENSPEAIALSDYFNKGGIGGITALDLGFSSTPSLYPDHLFKPQYIHDEQDSKFFLPSQSLCLGYLHPWHVPPLNILSKFAAVAAKSFLPSIPIVHTPSLKLSSMSTHTAFALSVTGGAFDQSGDGGEKFSNEMLIEKRVFLVRGFNKKNGDDDTKFASLQSMLLYQLLGLFHRDEQQRQLSHTFHGALIMMLRQLNLPSKIQAAGPISPPSKTLSPVELDLAWKRWIRIETWRRVTFIVFLADLETATHFNTAPLLPFSDLDIDLPSNDLAWNALDAPTWSKAMNSTRNPTAISYLSSIGALLRNHTPELFSAEGLLLAELTRLSSFPLLILSRTLSFLQMKTEESIAQIDPFRELLGGLNLFEGRENENRAVLEKIVKGRERLKKLPGGLQRGGSEGWWEGIIPTAAGRAEKMETDSNTSQAELENLKTKEYKKLTDQIKRATEVVAQGFPEFSNYCH